MRIRLQGGLLYVPLHLSFRGRELLNDVVLDTGSAGSVVSADAVLPVGVVPEPHDRLRRTAPELREDARYRGLDHVAQAANR